MTVVTATMLLKNMITTTTTFDGGVELHDGVDDEVDVEDDVHGDDAGIDLDAHEVDVDLDVGVAG